MENKDIYMCIKEVADFLGLKYHHTRKLLLADRELKCYLYGTKKLWKLDDIEAFKQKHIIAVQELIMAVTKHYLNKEKTKFNWRAVAYIPTGEYDKFGIEKKKHQHIGYYATKSEGEIAERNFWNELNVGTLELNKNATFEDIEEYTSTNK